MSAVPFQIRELAGWMNSSLQGLRTASRESSSEGLQPTVSFDCTCRNTVFQLVVKHMVGDLDIIDTAINRLSCSLPSLPFVAAYMVTELISLLSI